MAWNGSNGEKPQSAGRDKGSRNSPLRILMIGGGLAVAVLGYWLFMRQDTPASNAKQAEKSAKAIPVCSTNSRPVKTQAGQSAVKPKVPKAEHLKKLQDRFFNEALKMDPSFAERLEKFNHWKKTRPFHHLSEIEIAAVISARPGDFVLMSDFHPDLEKDFLEHLDDPIKINDDDTDDVKALKQQMIDLKPQLKRQIDKGEKLADILNDYRKEMQKVYQLKSDLQDELQQIKKKATSVEEVEDFVAAANKMLEEYGTEEIKMPLTKGALERIKLNAQNAENQGDKQ